MTKSGPNTIKTLSKSMLNTGIAIGASLIFSIGAMAQDRKAPVNAVTGSAWNTDVKVSGNEMQLTSQQKSEIGKINAYMNSFANLTGRFVQTNPDEAKLKGKFFVQRPGKMRFDYASPSQMLIVSDGQYLSIEDHDLKTTDRYPLESTPFRMLLKGNVNISRDAQILGFETSDKHVTVVIADRSGDSAGHIKLVFSKAGKLDLREWVITDAQGLNTRIEVGNLQFPDKQQASLFKPTPKIGLSKVFEN